MAAQGERVSGAIGSSSSNVLDPMAQDIPEQDIVMGEQELPPQMDPKTKMAAACDASPPPLLRNPPPIPAESAQPSAFDMAQLCAMLAGVTAAMQQMKGEIKNEMNGNAQRMEGKMEANINGMKKMRGEMQNEMKEMRGEMRQVGQCLQAGKRATPRAATNELEGSAPAGEDRVIRETCRVTEKVTETVTREKVSGVTETCTRETRRQVTELTETREVVERPHGVEVTDAHTYTHTGSEGQWGRARRACWDPV